RARSLPPPGVETAAAVPTLGEQLGPATATRPGPPAAMPAVPGEPPEPRAPPAEGPTPVPEAEAEAQAARERVEEEGTERRLLEILDSLDLTDLPAAPGRRDLAPAQALERMRRGDWVELVARDGESAYLKVAWINRRRTVAL